MKQEHRLKRLRGAAYRREGQLLATFDANPFSIAAYST
jgi:hypothetical protein